MLKAIINGKSADGSPQNLVVRFSEAVDGRLPQGHSENPAPQALQKRRAGVLKQLRVAILREVVFRLAADRALRLAMSHGYF